MYLFFDFFYHTLEFSCPKITHHKLFSLSLSIISHFTLVISFMSCESSISLVYLTQTLVIIIITSFSDPLSNVEHSLFYLTHGSQIYSKMVWLLKIALDTLKFRKLSCRSTHEKWRVFGSVYFDFSVA